MQNPGTVLKPPEKACPLCFGRWLRRLDEVLVSDLCIEYRRQLGVDVRPEFAADLEVLELEECSRCGLQSFFPLVSGSRRLYSNLAAGEAYYSNSRWEFIQALRWMSGEARVIDVGCGDGNFLALIGHRSE